MSAAWSAKPVGIVAPRYAPAVGGVERYVEQLALGLVARGVPVEIVTTDPRASHDSLEMRDAITVRRFPTLAHDAIYYVSPAMTRWLRHEAGRYSLLHAHNLHTLVPLAASWGAGRGAHPAGADGALSRHRPYALPQGAPCALPATGTTRRPGRGAGDLQLGRRAPAAAARLRRRPAQRGHPRGRRPAVGSGRGARRPATAPPATR